jgi:hypothetical protein
MIPITLCASFSRDVFNNTENKGSKEVAKN